MIIITLIVASVTLGVLTGWLIDRHHTNTTDTGPKTNHTDEEEGK